jgi:hypothetical protein
VSADRLYFFTVRPDTEVARAWRGWDGDAIALHLHLRVVAFQNGGTLPADPAEIRLFARCSPELWRVWPVVAKEWTERDGALICKELGAEMERVRDRTEKLRTAGRAGGLASVARKRQASPKPRPNAAQASLKPRSSRPTDLTDRPTDLKKKPPERERGIAFAPPSVDEVRSFVVEKGYRFDAEAFVAHYTSKGWVIGRSPMKDWRAACVTWERRWLTEHPAPKPFRQVRVDPETGERLDDDQEPTPALFRQGETG